MTLEDIKVYCSECGRELAFEGAWVDDRMEINVEVCPGCSDFHIKVDRVLEELDAASEEEE